MSLIYRLKGAVTSDSQQVMKTRSVDTAGCTSVCHTSEGKKFFGEAAQISFPNWIVILWINIQKLYLRIAFVGESGGFPLSFSVETIDDVPNRVASSEKKFF